jgi:simple sugar transport system permease protein
MEAPIVFIAKVTISSSMAVLYATIGEIFTERSGVLNLGVEGMMLMGALTAVAAVLSSGSLWFGVTAAMLAGGALALLHGVFCFGRVSAL